MRKVAWRVGVGCCLVVAVALLAMTVLTLERSEIFYSGAGADLWSVRFSSGRIILSHFNGWPNAPHWRHQSYESSPGGTLSPVYSFPKNFGPSWASDWGPIEREGGMIQVALKPGGEVDWDTPVTAVVGRGQTPIWSAAMTSWTASTPLSLVALVFTLPLAGWTAVILRRRNVDRRRRAVGMCVGCGYDLRASVGRCPECGRLRTP